MSKDRVRQTQERRDQRRVAAGLPTERGQQAETDAKVLRLAEQNPSDKGLQEIAGQVRDRLTSG